MEYVGGGVDYDSGPYAVQFDVGETNASFIVVIGNDHSKEDNETFNLNISTSSLPSSVTVGDPSQTTVTIVNDDGKYRLLETSCSFKSY